MDPDDDTLAMAARTGDAAALGALLERHYDRVFRLAYRILGNRAEAEDLTQEICLALPRRLAGFRGEARFTSWLHRVVVNAARDLMRRNATRARAGAGWGEAEHLARAEAEGRAEEARWLEAAMSALSPALRETVALVLGEEMTHAEAAAALGLSEGTVSWRLSEVRRLLRDRAREEEIA
ncbi:RNA polymerase sigma factor [Paroceanicella profunda]|uniref:RNA polymerase sigma factor n=1 Tax=Paroceanicella profunda TaxID=2579971 RepID=A0A5B8FZY8_9RHOB|nr:RNA polymerase sigma factor [Paroceanicella profunda]QDL92302.1 RNA polymerase sigma factor [Paroceanicella profunda]